MLEALPLFDECLIVAFFGVLRFDDVLEAADKAKRILEDQRFQVAGLGGNLEDHQILKLKRENINGGEEGERCYWIILALCSDGVTRWRNNQ